MTAPIQAPFRALSFLERDVSLEERADGTLYLRNNKALAALKPHLPGMLAASAQKHPDRVWLAQRRGPDRQWQTLGYAQGLRHVCAVTQALLDLQQRGRCIVVLSANSLEHAVVQLAAMQAGMPYAPITTAYSLLTPDLEKLQAMVDLLEPAVVFAQNGVQYERALRGLKLPADCTRVVVEAPLAELPMVQWQAWQNTMPTPAVAASVEAIDPDNVAKYLFTSGSTGMPKATIVTHRMISVAVTMHEQMIQHPHDAEPGVMLDWMPWSHVASGNILFGTNLCEGASTYLDEGKPMPGAFDETLRNLREVSPTHLSSVPLGYNLLADALESDDALASRFFKNLQRLSYAGARLPDTVFTRLQNLAVKHTGFRIPFTSAFGSTETSAAVTMVYWCADWAGFIGLPHPGVVMKLVPLGDGRYEVRVRSDGVTPGYLHQPQATAQAFDEEGYFRMGDALTFVDRARPEEGLVFAGRVTEEFKLQSGIFVRVGALRVQALESAGGLLADAVVTGADETYVGLLAWPHLAACRQRLGQAELSAQDLLQSPDLHQALREAFAAHNRQHTGSSLQIRRIVLLAEPPSMGAGEITDKGYVNQRTALQRRADQVRRLYTEPPAPGVIVIA
jgi:feruloyl-CoA synthase